MRRRAVPAPTPVSEPAPPPPPPPRLLLSEAGELLRWSHALHDPALDPAGRKRLLLDGAGRLVGADRGLSVVTQIDDATGARSIVSLVRLAPPGEPPASAARPAGGRAADAGESAAPSAGAPAPAPTLAMLLDEAGVGRCVDSSLLLAGLRLTAWLVVGRRDGDSRRFTPRQRAVVQMMHEASARVYAPDVLLASADARALAAPSRAVLPYLLAGASEQEIAPQLRLSLHAVQSRVKRVYRHFRVTGRAELLARGVGGTRAGKT